MPVGAVAPLTVRAWHGTGSENAAVIREDGFDRDRISTQGLFCAGIWASEDAGGSYSSGNGALSLEYEARQPLVTYNDGYRGGASHPIPGVLGFQAAQQLFIQHIQEKRGEALGEGDKKPSLLFREALLDEGYDDLVVHGNPVGDATTTFHCLLDTERIKVVG